MRIRTTRLAILALSCAAGLAIGCARDVPRPAHRSLASLWNDFMAMPEARALALAGDPDRLWVAGATGGHATEEMAEENALAECRRKRLARRMQAPCRLYATGDEVVWGK